MGEISALWQLDHSLVQHLSVQHLQYERTVSPSFSLSHLLSQSLLAVFFWKDKHPHGLFPMPALLLSD